MPAHPTRSRRKTRGKLETFLPRLGEAVAVPLDEGRPVVVALVRHVVHLFVLYPQEARVVLRHHLAVIPYVPPVRVLLVPQADVLPGPYELPLPQGFRLQVGIDEFLHLARDVGVHLPRVFQEPFHVVVHVVPGDLVTTFGIPLDSTRCSLLIPPTWEMIYAAKREAK